MKQRKTRLAYLVTHPIQYQAPLLRKLAKDPEIDLTVFFCSDVSVMEYVDPGFGTAVRWDVPLLEGYRHVFLPALGRTDQLSFWRPFNYGLVKRLRDGRFDVLWVHGYARWLNWVAILAAKTLGIRVLIRDEATLISVRRGFGKRVMKRLFFSGLNILCDGFLAIGSLNRQYYLSQGIGEEKIFLMPYAVDNAFFQDHARAAEAGRERLRADLGFEHGRPIILYASKMIERKRPMDLLEAYIALSPNGTEAPDPYLLFVGDGQVRPKLECQAAALGWDSIRFVGFKNQTELPAYFDLCDLFVLSSVDEPWGLVVNEVMNAGKAIIASDQVGCSPDLVRNGENGYSFTAGSIDDLHRALCDALKTPEWCCELGRNSLKIIDRWGFEDDISGLKRALMSVCYGRDVKRP